MTRRVRAHALIAAASVAVLGACSQDDATEDPTRLDDRSPVTGGETPTAETGAPATEPGDGPTAGAGDVPPEYDGVMAAVELAVADQGGPAFEVDDGDGGIWEVHVAVGEDDMEVHVSADGSEILSTDREADLDSTDRDGLEAAGGFTLAQALRAGIVEYGGTSAVDEVTISDEGGDTYAWEVAFADDVEVYLDIATGELLRVETD